LVLIRAVGRGVRLVSVEKPYNPRLSTNCTRDLGEAGFADVVVAATARAVKYTPPRWRRHRLADVHDTIHYVLYVAALYDSGWCSWAWVKASLESE
jgi:hypothetical protein